MESEILLSTTLSDRDYPSPPQIHWLALLIAGIVLQWLINVFVPSSYLSFVSIIVDNAWVFYFCLWLRKLEPDSKSIFWGDAAIVLALVVGAITTVQDPSLSLQRLASIFGFTSAILGLVTIFNIRAELVRHYNEKENYGLQLSGVMTFFFSFVYFQYHLYDIAKSKRDKAAGRSLQAGKTLFK